MVAGRERVGRVSHQFTGKIRHAKDVVLGSDNDELSLVENAHPEPYLLAFLVGQGLLEMGEADELSALEVVQKTVTLNVLFQAARAE